MGFSDGYAKWPSNTKIPLGLSLVDESGRPVSGAAPECAIRRIRETHGLLLDSYYWDGVSSFVATPVFLPMVELDPAYTAGYYTYIFDQDVVGLEYTYLVYYRNTTSPVGFAAELHIVTNELLIPTSQPDPVVVGPESVLGQLQLIKDGGTGQFNPVTDSLHTLRFDTARILGLLHQNAMVDRQLYGPHGMLTSARVRVFDAPERVPSAPNGNETLGLTQEYAIEADYQGTGANAVLSKYVLKRVR